MCPDSEDPAHEGVLQHLTDGLQVQGSSFPLEKPQRCESLNVCKHQFNQQETRSPAGVVLTSTSTASKALQPGKVNKQGMLTNIDINTQNSRNTLWLRLCLETNWRQVF